MNALDLSLITGGLTIAAVAVTLSGNYMRDRASGRQACRSASVHAGKLSAWATVTGASGVSGEMKNLIFASTGPKPKIVLRDAVNNDLEITENGEHCLVYGPAAGRGRPHLAASRRLVGWTGRPDRRRGARRRERPVQAAAEIGR